MRLGGIERLALRKVLVLRMPEHKVGNAQLIRQPRRVERGAVVLFIGLEAVGVRVQAERLAQQPVRPFDIAAAVRVVRLIAQTGQPRAAVQRRGEAELQQLRGADVKERDVIAAQPRL